jgi:hypothetical protein
MVSKRRISLAVQPDTFRPTDEIVNQRANPTGQNDHENPNDFIIALTRLLGRAIYNHPNPESDKQDCDGKYE